MGDKYEGRLGTELMGVKGAALATVLSQACSAVWVLSFLCSRRASPLRYSATLILFTVSFRFFEVSAHSGVVDGCFFVLHYMHP